MAESPVTTRARFTLRRNAPGGRTFADDARDGLTAVQKSLSPRYFYDELGSSLFDAICSLPEYYPTRAESELLRRHGAEIAAALGSPHRVIEFGSGSAHKTRLLLDEFVREGNDIEYVPIDIDPQALEKSGRELLAEYESLRVSAICADFTRPSRALADAFEPARTIIIFLGSTIGNFQPREAAALLADARRLLRPGDTFLLGVDLAKPKEILEPAYNDALGVTAAFNLNLLQRINRELGGHFDLHAFAHRAFFNAEESRIEMHLVSLREQTVHIEALNLEVSFGHAETIHTENSYKYDEKMLASLARDAGFEIVRRWTDSRGWFADVLLKPR